MAMMIACITLRNSISTNFSTCLFLLQDLAILVEDLASSRTRLMLSAALRLQPTPASVVQVEVLLEICSIIVVVVAIIICFCICKCLAAHKAHVVLILYRLLLLLQVSETIANIPFAPFTHSGGSGPTQYRAVTTCCVLCCDIVELMGT